MALDVDVAVDVVEARANARAKGQRWTKAAQEQLGDIVFAEVTKLKEKVLRNDDVAVVESVKAASDIFAPVSGTVIEWNDLLDDAPETLNSDPTKSGWVFKMTIDAPEELQELMDEAAYNKFIEELK